MRCGRMLAEDEPQRLMARYQQEVCALIFAKRGTMILVEFRKCFSSSMSR